ncbi:MULTISPECIES: methyltransferase family protein [Vibrio]|uniref:Isoprenylcysteine carboxylmethyltransferase family protein n=2 Tax=Vibrio TaxID=662 RepID=A0A7X4LLC6_9VIBR|nr:MULTISPECIES: isoprenylcysteine carboxylmethyltransferase family protein [Vibrio]MBF9000115.1 isoprenylcysteine carboxylmethyltransferase family protein [Vibrio nitrifigilis]MZI93706.1 hypothetical protein [Vibrio eleionomae]
MQPRHLELKIPPVVLFMIALVAMYACITLLPQMVIRWPFPRIGFALCFILSGFFGLAGVAGFRRAKTTVNPAKPDQSSCIVASGVFRLSRNPMYLGLTFLLIGTGYYLQNIMAFVVVWAFIVYLNHFQIKPEERILEGRFGDEYRRYKQEVRRWL